MRYTLFVIIALLSIAVYANSIPNGFVYDDDMFVVGNPYIRDMSNIPEAFLHPEYLSSRGFKSHYRPLVLISHTINYWIGGLNPVVFRLTNILFHIGSAYLLLLTVMAMLDKSGTRNQDKSHLFIALAAALIFAVHPFNSEAVNYITARSSLMAGFFYLLSFYCWVKYRQSAGSREQLLLTVYYMGSLLAFLLGMLSKEAVITLPLVLWLYDLYFRNLHSASGIPRFLNYRTYLLYLPFILFPAAALAARAVYTGEGFIPSYKRDIASQVFTMVPVLAGYLKLLFLPTGLTIAHDADIYSTPFALPVIISVLVLLLYVINAIYLYRRKEMEWRVLSFFMMWYLITLLVIIMVPLNSVMQENRCYISGALFAVFLAVLIGVGVYSRQRLKLAYGILGILIVLYGIGTVYRNMVWKNGVTLWTDAMEKSPYEPLVYNNLSAAYKDAGDYDRAKDVLYKGIRFSPGDALLHYNLGVLLAMSGDLDYALDEFDRALATSPEAALIFAEKGNVYLRKGETEKGMGLIQAAIQKKPEYAPAHYYLAMALQKLGRTEEARRELDVALHYAEASNDRRLVEHIKRYEEEGHSEKEIVPGGAGINQ